MDTVVDASIQLKDALQSARKQDKKRDLILDHISKMEEHKFRVPEFDKGLEWMNVSRGLSFKEQLDGKVCLLDFFTYCCINCMHILPDLHVIESKHTDTDGLAIVGVHSAKFDNEKTSANILSAILRYNITHPVVNDHQTTMWNRLGIMCWPTVVVIGPTGHILLSLAGEGHREILLDFVSAALSVYQTRGIIKSDPIGHAPIKLSLPSSPLMFPGKICLNDSGERLIISDTGHHRVLVVVSQTGVVEECIGSGSPGLRDGSFDEAQFNSPQGICYKTGGLLYVADTENHTIREIDLNRKVVVTVVGTGHQGSDLEGGRMETEQEIGSPWDVVLCPSEGSTDSDVLVIAMAGTHQLWTLFLKDATWIKKRYDQGVCVRWAGSGQEQNRNNSYPHKAAFAQPSGLSVDHQHHLIYVADSESSSIRSVSIKDGAVKSVAGGERDPTNLFAFGDKDGKGVDAKFQHPLAVAVVNEEKGEVAVADSYNHKIKVINSSSKLCNALFGSGRPGNVCGPLDTVEMNEPGGLCVDQKRDLLYIADTNNHVIKVFNRSEGTVSQLPIVFPKVKKDYTDYEPSCHTWTIAGKSPVVIREESLNLAVNSTLEIELDLNIDNGGHLTEGAPSSWLITTPDCDIQTMTMDKVSGKLDSLGKQPKLKLHIPSLLANKDVCVKMECMVYYCSSEGVCKMKGLAFVQNFSVITSETTPANVRVVMQHKLT